MNHTDIQTEKWRGNGYASEQEQIWIDGIRAIMPKFKRLGWKRSSEQDCISVIHGGKTLQIVVLDKRGRKHWLRVCHNGEIAFAPTEPCIGNEHA